jgi:hypothetical protein
MKLKIFSNRKLLPAGQLCHMMLPFWEHKRDDTDPDAPRFDKYITDGKEFFEVVNSVEEADVAVYPAIPKGRMFKDFQRNAKSKPVIAFFNSDSDEKLEYGDNTYIFRTSFYKSSQRQNEFALPGWSADFGVFGLRQWKEKPTISFCGQVSTPAIRNVSLNILECSDQVDVVFVRRNAFCAGWLATGRDKEFGIRMKEEYIDNISQGDYVLCVRGGGNFSYRIYETMMCGRIPLLIDTDCVLPYDFFIDWKNLFPVVNQNEVNKIPQKLLEFHSKFSNYDAFEQQQKLIRKLWEEYISPTGFFKNIHKHIEVLYNNE